MGSELGEVTAHMTGRVVTAQEVEEVLAVIPEQVWAWDQEVASGVTSSSTVDVAVEVPMRVRREIIALVLFAVRT